MQPSHNVAVVLEDDLLVFNRVLGVLRRRNLPVIDIRVGAAAGDQTGSLRMSFSMQTDDANAERLLRQLEKAHGVRGVEVLPVSHSSEAVS
jgi:acetolactate synthase regulatory subunit